MKLPRLPRSQAAFLARRLDEAARAQPELRELRSRLLAIGGRALVAPRGREPDLRAILACGAAFDGANAARGRGRSSDCHANVARLWTKAPDDVLIATGYALSDDGLWRQHTWALRKDRLVETTEPRLLYFGIVLSPARARKFAAANG